MVESHKRVQKNQLTLRLDEAIYQAWHTAMFERQPKLPQLEDWLSSGSQPAESKPQTPAEMMAMAKLLTKAFGGKIVEK